MYESNPLSTYIPACSQRSQPIASPIAWAGRSDMPLTIAPDGGLRNWNETENENRNSGFGLYVFRFLFYSADTGSPIRSRQAAMPAALSGEGSS